MPSVLNQLQKFEFEKNGFVIVKNFFDKEETLLLQKASNQDPAIRKHFMTGKTQKV